MVFCDGVPHVITWLKRRRSSLPLVYYGHFPDVMLTGSRASAPYRSYRRRLDAMEETGLAAAEPHRRQQPLYGRDIPTDVPKARRPPDRCGPPWRRRSGQRQRRRARRLAEWIQPRDLVLLVPGRIDPRKNLPLAVYALAALRNRVPPGVFARVRLVIAGRYDDRWAEVRAVREKIDALVRELDLRQQVDLAVSG